MSRSKAATMASMSGVSWLEIAMRPFFGCG
jgi:hypothetical protein